MNKPVYDWNIYQKDDDLVIELNGGINSILDMKHELFEENKQSKKHEIRFYSQIAKTNIKGKELLGL